MLVDCTQCKARVNAEEVAEFIGFDDELQFDVRYVFLKCPSCVTPLITIQHRPGEGEIWDSPRRIHPPVRRLSFRVPTELRRSFQEALQCHESGHYLATALMCRRTLEGVCSHHLGKVKNLSQSLKELHSKQIIDDRLYEWATALRDDGNLAAHDMSARISQEDATDLVDFSEAILDYVFVLRDRFVEYKTRRAQRGTKPRGKSA
jgi:hypothetical protein